MAGKKLTEKRRRILDFIERTSSEHGYPPTVREIGQAVGLKSSSSVQFHLQALKETGYLQRDGSLTRALRVVGSNANRKSVAPTYVPLVGEVAAGQPILAQENIEEMLPFPAEMVGRAEAFCLRVKGQSMVNKGIFDGDLVLVQRQPTAENGDTVVALLDDEATVKTFYKDGSRIELRPENDAMQPIVVNGDVQILGKVRAVLRSLD